MDFVYLLRILSKRKWIIISAAIIAAAIAYFLMGTEDKKYRSVAQISTGFAISDEIKVNDQTTNFLETDTKFNNAIVTWMSPTVISLLSYKLILHDLQSDKPFHTIDEKKKQSPVYIEINKKEAINVFENKLETMGMLTSYKPEEKRLLEFLQLYGYDYKTIAKSLSVYRVDRTDYIQVEYTSSNPELSAYVVNTSFQQFLRYYQSVRNQKTQESIDTLRSLLDKKKQDLDAKNALLRNEGLVDVGQENSSKFDLIMNLETSLTNEKNKQTTLQYNLQKVNQKLAELGPETGSNSHKNNDGNDELLILRKQMNDAYTDYLHSGSNDQALLKKYNQLKEEYQNKVLNATPSSSASSEPGSISRSELIDQKNDIELDIKASNAIIESIQAKINSLKENLIQDESKRAAIESLLKDAELANKEYLDAKQKYNDAIDINSSSLTNFRQVLIGQPAIDPEPSKKMLIVGMAGVGAAIITMLIIVLLAYLDSSVKTPNIFARIVNLKLISMVNFMNLKNKELAEIVANKDGSDDPDKKRHNVFRESIRKLRYEIESSGKKIILLKIKKKGEGKTTLIQALSYSLSLSKKKILIIDTNFCNNDLTVLLNAEPVLEKIIPNENDTLRLIDQVKSLSKDVGVGTVFAIGSEGGDYTPSEILPRENLLQYLHDLTPEFDYIFLEGPPLNDFSDSKELSQYVDGVIAVFSANHIIKQIDKESIQFFKELNGKFCGAILNMIDLENVNVT